MDTDYATLQIPPNASREQVKRAWRRACLQLHPDRVGGSTEAFQRVQRAYASITTTDPRATLDEVCDLVDISDCVQLHGGVYTRCRCGSECCIDSSEWNDGVRLVSCPGCSLLLEIVE